MNRHEWERGLLTWDLLSGVILAAAAAVVWFDDEPRADRVWSIAFLLAIPPLYAVLARPVVRSGRPGGPRGFAYTAGAIGLFAAATALAPAAWCSAFAVITHLFMVLPVGWAIASVVVLSVGPAVPQLLTAEDPGRVAGGLLANTLLIVTFSAAFGHWIERIIRQSQERAELIEQLTASRAEVARLSREAGVAAERERLAGEIHDTLAQGFTTILMLLQGAEARLDDGHPARRPVELAARTARENLAEARALVAALPPAPLQEAALADAIGRLVDRFAQDTGAVPRFETEGTPRTLEPSLEVVLLRAAQEALANVRKHAAASDVRVRLSYRADEVRLLVSDDGRGFDPRATAPGADGGFGLAGMRRRVEQIGGTVEVASAPGDGTALTVTVPCASMWPATA
ncbi:sensor histidine kinase [Thermomonospora cellulosilytica]|uniref:Oxygen sensor histidine kinase NreB n=1 Tax=Thermomonospora cellulosilytica TaxID=1411118 RepID=A0A7W3N574_9ACTN|nr:sensor histidine kinase [Thermomonospora cellulosilytica]MBA9007698.1 signal transduction histidine kinase [Thermomonospora cellulosilytica]